MRKTGSELVEGVARRRPAPWRPVEQSRGQGAPGVCRCTLHPKQWWFSARSGPGVAAAVVNGGFLLHNGRWLSEAPASWRRRELPRWRCTILQVRLCRSIRPEGWSVTFSFLRKHKPLSTLYFVPLYLNSFSPSALFIPQPSLLQHHSLQNSGSLPADHVFFCFGLLFILSCVLAHPCHF